MSSLSEQIRAAEAPLMTPVQRTAYDWAVERACRMVDEWLGQDQQKDPDDGPPEAVPDEMESARAVIATLQGRVAELELALSESQSRSAVGWGCAVSDVDQLRADMEAGTEPHWWKSRLDFYLYEDDGYSDQKTADYSRIARVPDMENTIMAQADEIARLARLRDDLESAFARGAAYGQQALKDAGTLVVVDSPELATLRDENARLRAALRPFADAAETWMPEEPDDDKAGARIEHPKYGMERHAAFTFGDLFRARAALGETP